MGSHGSFFGDESICWILIVLVIIFFFCCNQEECS